MPDSVLLNESNFILTNQWIKSVQDCFADLFRMFGFGFEWVIRFDSDGIWEIPSEIGWCINKTHWVENFLQYFLSGSIPSEIGEITKLRVLEIAQNSVTGTILETLRDQTTEFVGNTDIECSCCC